MVIRHTCLRGPSNIWSVSSELLRGRLDGRSPMYLRMAWNMKHASSASSSFETNLRSNGNLSGSLVCLHNSSLLKALPFTEVNALPFDIVVLDTAL